MQLIFVTEARFHKGENGEIYSQNGSYGLILWSRYLKKFDNIIVIARVEKTLKTYPAEYIANSERIRFIELPYYVGFVGFLKNKRQITKILNKSIYKDDSRVICRVPGLIGTTYARLLKKFNIPYAVEVVGDPVDVFTSDNFNFLLSYIFRVKGYLDLKFTVKFASAVLYVTKFKLQQRYPSNSKAFLTNASNVFIPDNLFKQRPNTFTLKPNGVKLLAIGSLAQMYKSPDIVLKSLKMLKDRDFKFHLTWLGDGKFKQKMLELRDKLGLTDNVSFLGNLPAGSPVFQKIKESDLYIHVSRTEGLPRSLIEAMAHGLPCIGTRVGGIPELLNEDSLLNINDPIGLANKIAVFCSSKTKMEQLSAINFKTALDYRNSILVNRREIFYENIIKQSKI